MVLLIIRGLLRRPSLPGTPTAIFCSLYTRHNASPLIQERVMQSTELLTAASWVHEEA